jgi:D-alanine-D-alanine ligase-like ATP-grasp enzyme
VVEPAGLRELGVAAVAAVGLDFGAVDIIWNQTQDRCYVLEINTAPGLCNTTCQKYAEAFTANYGG